MYFILMIKIKGQNFSNVDRLNVLIKSYKITLCGSSRIIHAFSKLGELTELEEMDRPCILLHHGP